MTYAIKAEVSDAGARTFAFRAHRTMYGGKHIAEGDVLFVFADEKAGDPPDDGSNGGDFNRSIEVADT